MIRIVLVEDDPIVLGRFVALLSTEPDFCMVGAFGEVGTARAFLQRCACDVLLVDLGLPDEDGTSLIHLCATLHPACEVVVVTVFADSERVFACLLAGASGYVLKDEMPGDIVQSVRTVLAGGSPLSPSIARRVLDRLGAGRNRAQDRVALPAPACGPNTEARLSPLTPREVEILGLAAKGLGVASIGGVLGLSPLTVGTHVKNLYRKLAVHSRSEAVFEARELGLLRR